MTKELLDTLRNNYKQAVAAVNHLSEIVTEQVNTGVERFDREGISPELLMLLAARFELQHHKDNLVLYRLDMIENCLDVLVKILEDYPELIKKQKDYQDLGY